MSTQLCRQFQQLSSAKLDNVENAAESNHRPDEFYGKREFKRIERVTLRDYLRLVELPH